MKRALPTTATAIVLVVGIAAPVLGQGFFETIPSFRDSGAVGVGAGHATKHAIGTVGNTAARQALQKSAAHQYISAVNLEKAGKLGQAAALFASFASARQKLYGTQDDWVLKFYDRAAILATRGGKPEDAKKYMQSALVVCQRVSGSGSPEAQRRMVKLGITPPSANPPQAAAAPASDPETAAATPEPTSSDLTPTQTTPPPDSTEPAVKP